MAGLTLGRRRPAPSPRHPAPGARRSRGALVARPHPADARSSRRAHGSAPAGAVLPKARPPASRAQPRRWWTPISVRVMPPQALTIEQVLSVLEETPQRLGVLADGMSEARLRRSPAPGEWSASEILAHLRACADVWSGAIETIVLTDHPTVRAVNPRTWIERTDYRRLPFEASMRSFAEQRVNLLAVLGRSRRTSGREAHSCSAVVRRARSACTGTGAVWPATSGLTGGSSRGRCVSILNADRAPLSVPLGRSPTRHRRSSGDVGDGPLPASLRATDTTAPVPWSAFKPGDARRRRGIDVVACNDRHRLRTGPGTRSRREEARTPHELLAPRMRRCNRPLSGPHIPFWTAQ